MYRKFSVYVSIGDADRIEDAICALERQSAKIGYSRQVVVEQHLHKYVQDIVEDYESNPKEEI